MELRASLTSELRPRRLKLVDGEIAPRYRVDGAYLEKVLDDKHNPAARYYCGITDSSGKQTESDCPTKRRPQHRDP